jgi:cytochrome P450
MVRPSVRIGTVIRERIPPLAAIPLPGIDQRLLDKRRPVTDLATPPAGSGLRPVPGDAGAPLIGHTFESIHFGPDYLLRRQRYLGPVSWVSAFGQRIVVLCGPDAVQVALVNKDKAFSQDGWTYYIGKFFGRGLMLLDFGEHHLHRRIMQEAFTRARVAGYVSQMVPILRAEVGGWSRTGQRLRLYPAVKRLTLDVATRVFMDLDSDEQATRLNQAFVSAVRAGTALVRVPVPGGRWAAGLAGRRVLEDYFAQKLPAKRRADGGDLFSALCHATTDDGVRFTDTDVVNHMIFLMMAAHDTVTIACTAAAYHLARHTDWQDRARAESLRLGDEPPDLEALDQLHALDLVIKESLRLVSPVPNLARRTLTDTEVLGHYVPAGTLVSINMAGSHFAPECWTDPYAFDPERFDEPRREDRSHRYAWMPFGGGVHKCIGLHFGVLEVKALLHEMLRTYRWTIPEDYRARWDHTSLPVPVDGLPVTLARRGRSGPHPPS